MSTRQQCFPVVLSSRWRGGTGVDQASVARASADEAEMSARSLQQAFVGKLAKDASAAVRNSGNGWIASFIAHDHTRSHVGAANPR
ncbi:MAG: hypothetical protein AADX96_23690 [Thiocapsa sp. C3-sup]|uniref:hypothetical protein n=1 Tax=unclassified Thiocapsa TaxID=2641286 RepID=UPI0035B30E74